LKKCFLHRRRGNDKMTRSQKDGTYWPKRVRGTSYYVRYRRLLLLNAFSCPQ